MKIWDLITHEVRATLRGHTDEIEGMLFSPDGRTLITVGGVRGTKGEVRVWRGASDEEIARRARLEGEAR